MNSEVASVTSGNNVNQQKLVFTIFQSTLSMSIKALLDAEILHFNDFQECLGKIQDLLSTKKATFKEDLTSLDKEFHDFYSHLTPLHTYTMEGKEYSNGFLDSKTIKVLTEYLQQLSIPELPPEEESGAKHEEKEKTSSEQRIPVIQIVIKTTVKRGSYYLY